MTKVETTSHLCSFVEGVALCPSIFEICGGHHFQKVLHMSAHVSVRNSVTDTYTTYPWMNIFLVSVFHSHSSLAVRDEVSFRPTVLRW